MKRLSIVFLQVLIVVIGIGAITFMLIEPHREGRNATATPYEIYFNDPFLAYAYIASIAFFILLYQAFKLLAYVGQNEANLQRIINALRIIKLSATSLVVLGIAPVLYLSIVRPEEDIAGGVAMGLLLTLFSTATAIIAGVLQKKLSRT